MDSKVLETIIGQLNNSLSFQWDNDIAKARDILEAQRDRTENNRY